MEKKTRHFLFSASAVILLLALLFNPSNLFRFLAGLTRIFLPIIIGGILAVFLNVPVNGTNKALHMFLRFNKRQPSEKGYYILSFFITILLIIIVLLLVSTIILPEVIQSAQSLFAQLDERVPQWIEYISSNGIDSPWLENYISGIDIKKLAQSGASWLGSLLGGVALALTSTIGMVVNVCFAIIFAIYMILYKKRLCRHSRKLILAYLKPVWADGIISFSHKFSLAFAKFLSGQCSEALILGVLMYFAFLIFRLPYTLLVGTLTAICALIPYIGAFASFAVSIFLTAVVDPALVIRCAAVYLIVQFIENQFIYPRVVGSFVGLPPIYTLTAALIGGKLLGITGILFFIPLAAVLFDILRNDAGKKLAAKRIDPSDICSAWASAPDDDA